MAAYVRKFILRSMLILAATTLGLQQVCSQSQLFRGVVRDQQTLLPLKGTHIRLNKSMEGTFTGYDGSFSLRVRRVPATITISCVGYETLQYTVTGIREMPEEILLKQITTQLPEVGISASRFSRVFNDKDYSVLDYEIMGDHLLLLVFRYRLNTAGLIGLTTTGDTLFTADLPEYRPQRLYRDFLGNVHYVSTKGNAFQCIDDKASGSLVFPYKISFDSLQRLAGAFLFREGDRTWFEERFPGGAGKRLGYIDGSGRKTYVRIITDHSLTTGYLDDQKFNSAWNQHAGNLPGNGATSYRPVTTDDDARACNLFYSKPINAPIARISKDRTAIFNFNEDRIELMDQDGKLIRQVPIDFHKERNDNLIAGLVGMLIPTAEWSWCGKIYPDEKTGRVWSAWQKHGITRIRAIDPETGAVTGHHDIPVPFPEKIGILDGEACFLYKESENGYVRWRLGKIRLW